ncbi:MAG: hypothetical protein Q9219_002920 [cf. Caloplaca sp. 3 TL-2023]
MPSLQSEGPLGRKRKREDAVVRSSTDRSSKARKIETTKSQVDEEILLLESQILKSRRHYNKISTLLHYCRNHRGQRRKSITAAVALCRVFCRLIVCGSMSKRPDAPENETIVVQWLRSQLEAYHVMLLDHFFTDDAGMQSTALTLLMRLLKDEAESLDLKAEYTRRDGAFSRLISRIVSLDTAHVIRQEFMDKFLQPYDDVRYFGFACLRYVDGPEFQLYIGADVLEGKQRTNRSWAARCIQTRTTTSRSTPDQKQAQELWLQILRHSLTKSQRKTVLSKMAARIAPWFTRLELLMDFLTDSFNAGGSIALAALSGIFHLMQNKNLDYAQFYLKLYSLLTPDALHSKRHSHFLRLLDTFLSSTHLPAALVASFIKRLSRLALFAPPSTIVVIIPWVYNILRSHPSCTFMVHKRPGCIDATLREGLDDPFDMEHPDPMESNATESSLWELHALQTHYHPNVSMIAKIISEQFLKQAYNLEDFLDHSYASMLSTELLKKIKKPPVVEYGIPKKIFLGDIDSPDKNHLLATVWDFA